MSEFKYAVCNELFGSLALAESARVARSAGYAGLEFAPYTIFEDFSPDRVRKGLVEVREVLDGEGLAFVGFHWLLAGPGALHLADSDRTARAKAVDRITLLAECAGRLGGGVLVLGSPRQRGSLPGVPKPEADAALDEALRATAARVGECGCSLLLEALSPEQTDVVNTLDEAVRRARAVGSPAVGTMFDFRNASSEASPWDVLLDRHFDDIRHIHANESDGRAPGTGKSDYLPAFRVLARKGYRGWISVEIFETPPDPGKILIDSRELFRRLEDRSVPV
ncbi:MAG TPA: sugar phosphate isomerase/epimerase family protein [Magnetospirillaceae bacterium]|nr:sugar phosphate isomerase/epimerase family protein [Magnetospirillaceae bacterium]